MINLRGERNKEKFIKAHDIKPISHQKLLNGQTKYSVGGTELTDRYYCFLYNKKGQKEQDTFICGYSIAKRLLEMTNQAELPLFNPLKTENNATEGNNNLREADNGNQANHRQWNAVAKQLSNAINLFIAYWNKPINGVLAEKHYEVNQYYYNKPFDSKIKAVNTCLERVLHNKTLKDVQEELAKGNHIKEYNFTLLNEVLEKDSIPSQFG